MRLFCPRNGEDRLQVHVQVETELTGSRLLVELPVEQRGVAAEGREDEEQADQNPSGQGRHA